MKKSIIILGLAALSFTSMNAANQFKSQDLNQQEFSALFVENNQETSDKIAEVTENTNFNPSTVIKSYVKTVEDVITENKSITESQEEAVQPLSIATTIEDRIAEDNQIIESTVSNQEYPLDFEKINRTVKSVRIYNNSAITVDLKL